MAKSLGVLLGVLLGVDADLAQRYPALISPVLSEHPLRFADTACGARSRLTAQVLSRTHPRKRSADAHCAERSGAAHGREPQAVDAQRRSSQGPASVDGRVEWLATPGPSLFKRFEWDEDVR